MTDGAPVRSALAGAAAAGVPAVAAVAAGAGPAAASSAAGALSTTRRDSTAWVAPSSRTVKSAAVRSRTSLPFLSRTTTSTTTAAVDAPNTGTSGAAGGFCAQATSGAKGPAATVTHSTW